MAIASISPEASSILLPVTITGPKGFLILPMILDTGASCTIASREAIEKLGYDPDSSTERVNLYTASGLQNSPTVRVAETSCLGARISGLNIVCHNLPLEIEADGLLGLDFLRNFNIHLRFRKNELEIL